MALEFDEQLSRLEKPNRNEMTNKEYAVFNENVETCLLYTSPSPRDA